MTTPPLVRDLFVVPNDVNKGDFVLSLSAGVENADATAQSYVVTAPIREALDRALGLVKTSIDDHRSRATYVHGSFGSGKSHFMAMLSLLLDDSEAAWRLKALHGLRDKHAWVKSKKVLQLRFHMISEPSLEAAIFGTYVRWIRTHRPDATVPPLFADEALFEDAARHLKQLGDEKFFEPMQDEAAAAPASGWEQAAKARAWTREKFEAAAKSTEPAEREKLFSALVKSHFRSYVEQKSAYVDIDSGLATMARHAKSLGFDTIVLFLDELVLWLASGASNASWLHTEVQKTAKLVEAQDASREIAIVSLIARQRDLADLVGDDLAGAENKRLRESLAHFQGRFDHRLELGDQNLPEIVEARVLQPKGDAAKKSLDDAFVSFQKSAAASWSTLVGQDDANAFRKLYPFSPALVETLVALSSSLQRNRTAIRLLMEILVYHIAELKVGDVVGVGDLFDVLAGGDDTADGVTKARFESAKTLYRYHLLPLIQETHGTGTQDKCQRLRPDHSARLGCSNCLQTACRADNRLVKTLLVSALVPEVKSLRELTASKLVQLNHGSLRAPIPGTEAQMAAQRLRNWASRLGQIHIGTQADPSIHIDIGGVDLEPILEQHRDADQVGNKQRIIRDELFSALGLDPKGEWGQESYVEWRGTRRPGYVQFGNVRRMTPEQLRCPDEHDWRLVLDYPFDDPGFSPNEDLAVIEKITEEGGGTWTLVLVPSFFSEAMNKLLGDIAVLDKILESKASKDAAIKHLRAEQHQNALLSLENLRSQKRARLSSALSQAYGFKPATDHDIDPSRSITNHLFVLKPEVKVALPAGAMLPMLREDGIPRLLEQRWPRHPELRKITKQVSARVIELYGQLIDSGETRIAADKDDVEKMRGTLEQLGIVSTTENAIVRVDDRTLRDLDRRRAQLNVEHPSVAEIKSWLDERRQMGLQHEAIDLVVRAYARAHARTLVRYSKAYEPQFSTPIPDDVVLEKPELPTQVEWNTALELAGHVFGVALAGKALHADNLRRFEAAVSEKVKAVAPHAAALPALLEKRLVELGLAKDADRMKTAKSANALCAALQGKPPLAQVKALAAFTPETSAQALGRSLASVEATRKALEDRLHFGVFAQLHGKDGEARDLLSQVERVLREDEIHGALAARLRTLAEAASVAAPPSVSAPVPASVQHASFQRSLRIAPAAAKDALAKVASEVAGEFGSAEEIEIVVHVRSTKGSS